MTDLDQGRKFDLEELKKDKDKAPNTFWRENYDRKINKVISESNKYSGVRKDLIAAVRSGDKRAVNYFRHQVQRMKFEETKGRQDY